MVQLSFRSPGVGTRETDLTGPAAVLPVGVPAGVIGTAAQGPAFVPVTTANETQFRLLFGESANAGLSGPISVALWHKRAQAATFMRVLGIGKGERRVASGDNAGSVESAGFVVGQQLPDADGSPDSNPYANVNGPLGRTYFLGCYMSESAGSTYFSEAGRQSSDGLPVATLRAAIFAPSGVVLRLADSTSDTPPSTSTIATAAGPEGSVTGTVTLSSGGSARQEFVLFLNGHIGSDTRYPRVITASFDMTAPNYIANVLNGDPTLIQEAGHLLYTHYDVHPAFAVVTGSGLMRPDVSTSIQNVAFITTGTLSRNSGSVTVPNFEGFIDRFATPKTSYFISQQFGGRNVDLFRVHALADGAVSNSRIKISIENIAKSNVSTNRYGTFDLLVRSLDDDDENKVVLERFLGLTLDPSSDRYIARAIGDAHVYLELDKAIGSQRLRFDGTYPNRSNYIRVEVTADVDAGETEPTALPVGFRGTPHLNTSGSSPLANVGADPLWHPDTSMTASFGFLRNVAQPPVPLRRSLAVGSGQKVDSNTSYYWGVQTEIADSVAEPNRSKRKDKTVRSLTKYFPNFHTSWESPLAFDNPGAVDTVELGVTDVDRFNNNKFTLENLRVITGSDGVASVKHLNNWRYVRNGVIPTDHASASRAFNVATDLGSMAVRNVAKFTTYLQGGFDGVNIFDDDATALNNRAVFEEMTYAARGQNEGPTVRAYLKALELMGNTTEVDVKLLSVPGMRHSVITDELIDVTEQRFDAMALIDVEERDTFNNVVTSSADQLVAVGNTVNAFSSRGLDTSFAAAYFPDVIIRDPFSGLDTRVPPTVAVLGTMALNDSIAKPWAAPAGYTRGVLETTIDVAVKLSKPNMDDLYDVDINPLVSFPGSRGVVVWGQKTLLRNQSSLDRINVRRLLIELRRQVRQVAHSLVFEPNRQATLDRFSDLVDPILKRIQEQQGIDGYKVQVDASTTTQADIENNTLRGKIYIRPTKTAEFVDLDFVLTNPGTI